MNRLLVAGEANAAEVCLIERIAALTQENAELKAQVDALRCVSETAQELLDAMEICHICKGTVAVEESPVHCEDCSYDCDSHEEPDCTSIYDLHRYAKAALIAARAAGNEPVRHRQLKRSYAARQSRRLRGCSRAGERYGMG